MKNWRRMLLIICILAVSLLAVSCLPGMREDALLIGAVTIGPITPVQKPGECPPVPPEVFAARKLIIYDESGKHMVRDVYFTQIDGGATGYFAATIGAGTYTIDINHLGMDRAANFPMKLTVSKDETVTIDVDIDTGIR